MHSYSSFKEVHELLQSEKQFAILCPIGIISELSRKENGIDNQWNYDQSLNEKVHLLSKLVLSQDNQVWLMNLNSHPRFVLDVLTSDNIGCSDEEIESTCCQSISSFVMENHELPDWDIHNLRLEHFAQTRSGVHNNVSAEPEVTSSRGIRGNKISVDPISNWVGKQLSGQNVPDSLQSQFQDNHPDFPDGLPVLPTSDKGLPRIIVPKKVQRDLVMQARLDIHHQHYRKVHKLLRPIYYWPSMDSYIERICKQCPTCHVAIK
jgi:hypothetical protein